jgi:DNA-3-methyladenine glycosylase
MGFFRVVTESSFREKTVAGELDIRREKMFKKNFHGSRLGRDFFCGTPVECARRLVGCELVWNGCGGVVVEVEAYSVQGDEACHTFSRPSSRRFVGELPAGSAYVYLNYGVHWLLNFLVKGGGEDGFVLVRALEPTVGISEMQRRTGKAGVVDLCSGPGKLTRALGMDGGLHGADAFARGSGFLMWTGNAGIEVASGPRVGISKAVDLPWRFFVAGNSCVSGGRQRVLAAGGSGR